ncbi:MAG: hypothetical protein KF789_03890 [Bdellovibrionaceae bacterium]|nr:hypothetical protein [Pseudobdellovibrionaceae bacterium]
MRLSHLFIGLCLFATSSAFAQNQMTYEGILSDDSGVIVPDGNYQLRFQIRSRDINDCLLYEEQKTIATISGQFLVHLGDGTGTVTAGSNPLPQVFTPNPSSALSCVSGSSPSLLGRNLRVQLNVMGSFVTLGDLALTNSPFAFQAQKIGPFSESNLVRTDMGVIAPQLDTAKVATLNDLLAGTYSGNAETATTCSSLSGTLAIANGGTGATTPSAALDNLLPTQSGQSGKVLQTDGLTAKWMTPAGGGLTGLTGDIAASGSGTVPATVNPNAITTAKIANDAVTSAKILNGSINAADLDFTGTNGATSSVVMRDSSGRFHDFVCATTGQVPTWTVTGFVCQTPTTIETDPKVGANTANMLSKWNGTQLIASNIFENASGNVGLGTTSPGGALHIYRNSASAVLSIESGLPSSTDAIAEFKQSNGNYGIIGFKQSGGGFLAGSLSASPFLFYTNSTERLRISGGGNVGIGTMTPTSTLEIKGAARNSSAISNASSVIDFQTGNLQYTTNSCGAFSLYNLKDGGTYSFAVQGTASSTCTFAAFSDTGVTGLTVHLPTNHGPTISGQHAVYSIMVMGNHAYFAWVKEFM